MAAFLFLTLPLFFYNLGAYSLVDFDEAWYAEIARNILRFHQPFLLFFNGRPYFDHPPLGFTLMAASFTIFGVNEFAARFSSVSLGFGAVFLVYFIGKTLLNRFVGLSAAFMLLSSIWFLFRAREADLDSPFLFFYLLSLFCAAKIKFHPYWLYLLALSLAAVFQVKSLVGVSILPAIVILLWQVRSKLDLNRLAAFLVILALALAPWILSSYLFFGPSFIHHLLSVGLRPGSQTLFFPLALTYLHAGIGKWYYPALLSLPLSLFFVRKKPQFLAPLVTTLLLFAGFLTNTKTEIWHLLPLYPLLFLILSAAIFSFIPARFAALTLGLILTVALYQLVLFRANFRFTDSGDSDLVKVSLAARGRVEPLYLDGQDFFPSTVFYSQKQVTLAKSALPPPDSNLVGIVNKNQRPFLLITEDWRLRADKIDPTFYDVLSQSGSWVLTLFKI